MAAVLVRDESPLQLRHGESSCSAPVVGSCRPIVLHRCLVRCRSATHGATVGRGRSTHIGQLCGLGEGHEGEARFVLKSGMKVTRMAHASTHARTHAHTNNGIRVSKQIKIRMLPFSTVLRFDSGMIIW